MTLSYRDNIVIVKREGEREGKRPRFDSKLTFIKHLRILRAS